MDQRQRQWAFGVAVSLGTVLCAACAAPFQRAKIGPSPPGDERAGSPAVSVVGRPTVGVAFGGGSAASEKLIAFETFFESLTKAAFINVLV